VETAASVWTNVQLMSLFFMFGLISGVIEQVDLTGG